MDFRLSSEHSGFRTSIWTGKNRRDDGFDGETAILLAPYLLVLRTPYSYVVGMYVSIAFRSVSSYLLSTPSTCKSVSTLAVDKEPACLLGKKSCRRWAVVAASRQQSGPKMYISTLLTTGRRLVRATAAGPAKLENLKKT